VTGFLGVAERLEMGEDLAPLRDFLQPLNDVLLPFSTHTPERWRTIMLDKKKSFNMGQYLLDVASVDGALTHDMLASLMPFYCCWLPDAEDESKPCAPSLALASMLFSTRLGLLGAKASAEPWTN